ncbi:signal transduction histidine kinase [Flavobacterium sp. 28YEA47A]|uniref:tetratricopeptide repeat-containing sensor histidine kinase n=1 Tax=Flavobacterium sp. 28YEA47A TaxID=3156276 RepID=UPI0035144889
MKLIYKIYSPFFLLFLLAGIVSCSKPKKEFILRDALDKEKSALLENYKDKAEQFMNAKIYDSAFTYYNKSLELQIEAKDTLGEGHSLIKMGQIHFEEGDAPTCEDNVTQGLALLENLQPKEFHNKKDSLDRQDLKEKYLSQAYNLLGKCYRSLLNPERAIEFYDKAKNVAKDSLALCTLENNKASVYIENQDYEKAYQILSNLMTSDVVLNDAETKARVLNNLGNVADILKKPEALSYLESSLNIRRANNLPIASNYIQLAKFYENKKNNNEAALYAQKAYEFAGSLKDTDKRLEALKILIYVSAKKEAAALKYIEINDSINKVRRRNITGFASLKYDSKNAEAKNLKLSAENAQAESDKLLLGIIGVSILIISGFVIYILRQRHKKAKIMEVHNTETRISKKIHDELANDVFNVMSYAESSDTPYPEQRKLIQDLDSIYQKTRDISRENNTIDTGENFGNVLREMLTDYKTATINLMNINFDSIDWNQVSEHKKITVYRVLQELMVNMKKHSHADVVVIKFAIKNKKITIQYTDNGKGLGKDALISKNGLQNAVSRISAIDGTLIFDTSMGGLKVTCTFPA